MTGTYRELAGDIQDKLKANLSAKRYKHILGVKETALTIGSYYDLNPEKLGLAALLHDFAKYFTAQELMDYCHEENIPLDPIEADNHGLLHGKVGRSIASKVYHIYDKDILNAISSHTTGRSDMSDYEKVLYLADYCDPGRSLPNSASIIELAKTDLSIAVFQVVSEKLTYIIRSCKMIHPRSLEVYNCYLSHGHSNKSTELLDSC